MIHNLGGEAAIWTVIITVQHGLFSQGQDQREVVLEFTMEINNN